MKVLAPAKVNLFLHILRKRADGYHELRTLFLRISLCDEIILKPRANSIQLRVEGMRLPMGRRNLAYRAAELLKTKKSVKQGVSILLRKRIPSQAGLGGGSSDAAAVLTGLNRFWRLGLSTRELMRLGARLGSDVSFFVMNQTMALATGRGEKLKAVKYTGPKRWLVIVKPPFGISTKEAYAAWGRLSGKLTPPRADVKMLVHSLQKGHPEALRKLVSNSLEVSLNKRVTTISGIQEKLLQHGALAALMSGSGSAVFGLFKTKLSAQFAARQLMRFKRYRVFVAATY